MRIAIMGSGGIGGYYGGRLAQAGEDVTFIARGAHLAALRSKGLQVFSHYGDFALPSVQATDDPAQIGPVDLVLMCTKTYDLDTATEAIRPLLGPETMVLPLLNGVDIAERIGAAIGAAHVLGGLCGISSNLAEPGVIRQLSSFEFFVFGELGGPPTPRTQAVEAVLRKAGVNVTLAADVRQALWGKFIFLASVAGVCAVTRSVLGPVRADPDTRALVAGSMAEIVAVGRAQGVALPTDASRRQLEDLEVRPANLKPSMALDLERGNRLEVEALNGTVVRLGQAAGVPTPVNAFLYAALKLHAGGRPAA